MNAPNWLKAAIGALNELVDDTSVSFADSAGQNTEQTADISLPAQVPGDGKALVTIHNPSSVSALTVQPQVKETFPTGGAQHGNLGGTHAVPTSGTASFVVDGLLAGEGGRLSVLNDTALGAGEGFTAEIRVRSI